MTDVQLISGSSEGPGIHTAVAELLGLLDREIEHARSERTRFGWTAWGLLVSIGAMVWAALSEYGANAVEPQAVAAWFVVASLISDGVLDGIVQRWDGTGDPSRLRLGTFMGRGPAALAAIMFRALVVLFALRSATYVYPLWVLLAVGGFYALVAAGVALLLVLLLRELPTQAGQRASQPIMVWGIRVLAGLAIIGAVLNSPFPVSGGGISAVRIGLLLGVATYLVTVLASDHHRDPLLDSLIEIRRSLGLGDVDYQSAMHRCQVVLRGLAFSDWVQSDVQALEDAYQQVVADERTIEELASACTRDLDVLTTGHADEPTLLAASIRSRLTAMHGVAASMSGAYERTSGLSAEIAGKIGYVRGMTDANPPDAEAITQAIDPMVNDAMKRFVRIDVQWPGFRSAVAASLTTLGL